MGIALRSPRGGGSMFPAAVVKTPCGLQVFPAIIRGCPASAAYMRNTVCASLSCYDFPSVNRSA
jgi:hypothetical protein